MTPGARKRLAMLTDSIRDQALARHAVIEELEASIRYKILAEAQSEEIEK